MHNKWACHVGAKGAEPNAVEQHVDAQRRRIKSKGLILAVGKSLKCPLKICFLCNVANNLMLVLNPSGIICDSASQQGMRCDSECRIE